MKIYQVHESGGDYESSYDIIKATYLHKDKAEEHKKELETEYEKLKMCNSCPIYCCIDCDEDDCGEISCKNRQVDKAKQYCDKCDIDYYEEDEEGYREAYCKNYNYVCDNIDYEVEEVDVIK